MRLTQITFRHMAHSTSIGEREAFDELRARVEASMARSQAA